MSMRLRRDPHRGRGWCCLHEPRRRLGAAVAARPAVRARVRQRAARLRDPGPAPVGLVPLDRPGDGAARTGAGRRPRGRLRSRRRRRVARSFDRLLVNLATFATFPLARRPRHRRPGRRLRRPLRRRRSGSPPSSSASSWRPTRSTSRWSRPRPASATACRSGRCWRSFVTALPSEFATGLLTASVAFTYGHLGMASVGLAAVILFVFLYILRTSVQAEDRGEELTKRTRELASLQMGLLSTVLQTLSMRDAMTARHSAAVARYSREVAEHDGPLRARAGPDPHRGAAARHRQVHPARLRPVRQSQAHRRRVGADQAPPGAGRQARRAHRGLRPRRRDRPAPPREIRRRRLPGRHRRRGHPARRAHHLRRRHLRRDDLARLLPAPRELRGRSGRAAPRRRARSWTRRSSRSSSA